MNPVTRAIVETLMSEIDEPLARDSAVRNDVASFVVGQIDRMPSALQLALRALTVVFDLSAAPRFGRRYVALSPLQRERCCKLWYESPIGTLRDFIRFHRSLMIFALYSRIDSRA